MATAAPSYSTSQRSDSPDEHPVADIPLDQLVTHLLASKRSLSSINSVWRANEIVTAGRTALEHTVVLTARTTFLHAGIVAQLSTLRQFRDGIDHIHQEEHRDFKNVLRSLDTANARLETTMDVLRSTMVEAAFRPESEEPRNLLDFVDEESVDRVRDALKDSIREAKAGFDASRQDFDDDLAALAAALDRIAFTHESSISSLLDSLETHAAEMASLLDSLVRHFDLCVNAIKHTEGGYAAVRNIASELPDGESVSGVINADDQNLEPLSPSDRQEMLSVLQSDAQEVEDVVMELRERLADMEAQLAHVQDHVGTLAGSDRAAVDAYKLLEDVSRRLPSYLAATQEFRAGWDNEKETIAANLDELDGIRSFYESYFSSYDSLILEVARRKSSEDKMKAVARKAMDQIEKLYEADLRERDNFRLDVGEYLPVDLWPGLIANGPRWEVRMRADDAPQAQSTPDVAKHTIDTAARREQDRQRS